jgi:uncharacterized repeat protein (TIGR03803 family)
MTNAAKQPAKTHMQSATSVLARAIVFVLVLVASGSAQAQTFTVLYTFTNTAHGEQPDASLSLDAAGNLYGTTFYGGTTGYGSVFKLDTAGKLTVLHSFTDVPDRAHPIAGLVLDKADNLYGTTSDGGDLSCGFSGCGTVFKLTPQVRRGELALRFRIRHPFCYSRAT